MSIDITGSVAFEGGAYMVVQSWWLRSRKFESRVTSTHPTEYKKFLCLIKGLISLCTKAFNITDITVNRMIRLPNDGFNKEKFKQVLHYIIASCGHVDNVGKTVLYKLSYFSDFDYYELYEEKLTGESYRRLPYGPAPIHFEDVINELVAEDKISQSKATYGAYPQFKYISKIEPATNLLNARERSIIDDVMRKYSGKNAVEVSKISHQDMPYKATNDLDLIDYEMVFYRDPETSVRNYGEDNTD